MIRCFCSSVWLVVSFTLIFSAMAVITSAQSQPAASQKDASQEQGKQKENTSDAKSPAHSADVSGDWHVSWEVRMGTNPGTLHLQQNGTKLTGTFRDFHGLSSLSGTVENNRISFDVQFQGKYPFTTRFTGTVSNGKIDGTSRAIDVKGEGGAFLGHGGEVQHPDHPWIATRTENQPASTSQPGSIPGSANPSAKN